MVILGRAFSPADYGAYSLVSAIGTFGVLIVGLNLYLYVYRAIPGRDADHQFSLLKATSLFEIGVAIIVVGVIWGSGTVDTLTAALNATGYERAFTVGLVLLIALIALAEVTHFLLGQFRIEAANWVDFLSQGGWIIPFAAWWWLGWRIDVPTVLLVQLAGCTAALGVGAGLIGFRKWWSARPEWDEVRRGVMFSAPMIVPSISFYVLRLSDRFFLSTHWNLSEVGLYSFAYTFVNTLYTFTAWAIFNSMLPRIIAAHNTGNEAQRDVLQTYMIKVSVVGFVLALTVLVLVYQPIIDVVARPEYRDAWRALPLLGVSYVFTIVTYPAGNMLFMQNRVKESAAFDVLGMIVGIVGNILLIPRWSFMGAAVASTLGLGTIMVAKYASSRTLSTLRMDVLFSLEGEKRLFGSYLLRFRRTAD